MQLRSWVDQIQLKDHLASGARDPELTSALDGLEKGLTLDQAQANSLEALIVDSLRPALMVNVGVLETPRDPWRSLEPARPMIERACAAVGRIDVAGLPAPIARACADFLLCLGLTHAAAAGAGASGGLAAADRIVLICLMQRGRKCQPGPVLDVLQRHH